MGLRRGDRVHCHARHPFRADRADRADCRMQEHRRSCPAGRLADYELTVAVDAQSTNTMGMAGRTVLGTGASGGLGRAVCELLARLGARVVLVARDRERLEAACAALPGPGHEYHSVDLGAPDAISPWMLELA